MITNKNILITGSRAPVALDLARCLTKNGYHVFCADSVCYPLSRFSKQFIKSFRVASPRNNTAKYISDLISICTSHKIELIIPTCEEIFYLAKFKELFRNVAHIFAEDFSILKTLHNKWDFICLLQSLGKEVPKSWLIQQYSDLKEISSKPIILKPVFSRFGSNVHAIKENDAFPEIYPDKQFPWIAQEFLEGKVWCSYSVAREGKVSLHTNYSSNFKIGQGASIHFEHENIPFIEDWVKDFVSELNFTGQIAFDFIQTEKNMYVPIECNPRSTSGIHLLSQTPGFVENFMHRNDVCLQPSNGISAILKLPMFVYGLSSIRSIKQLKDWFVAMKSKDIVFNTNDLIPSFYQFISFVEIWLKGIKLGISSIAASTYDLEFNGDL